jgi:hypothetical protein
VHRTPKPTRPRRSRGSGPRNCPRRDRRSTGKGYCHVEASRSCRDGGLRNAPSRGYPTTAGWQRTMRGCAPRARRSSTRR